MDFTSELIQRHEGLRLSVYKDTVGKRTIGFGFNLDAPAARAICEQLGLDYAGLLAGTAELTKDQAEAVFVYQITGVERSALGIFPDFKSFPEKARAVILDLIFNLGVAGFQQFKNFIASAKAGNWSSAADHLVDSKWYRQVKSRGVEDVEILRGL